METALDEGAIAIIGLAGRFPGACTVEEFWRTIEQGREAITFLTDEQLKAAGVPAEFQHPNYVRASSLLADIEYFDASFFGYTPREAQLMDPQRRLFPECAWTALEHASYDPGHCTKSVGVFAGSSQNTYALSHLATNRDLIARAGEFQTRPGNEKDVLSTRVSYKLNLHGPSITVQTACSTSLVALHLACQSLLNCECEMALAGGVSVNAAQNRGYLFQQDDIESSDGHCRALAAEASGTVGGSGLGIVVRKRLSEALRDGDTIHAIIRGSAVNTDGDRNAGYTAPSTHGQTEVIVEAVTVAGIDPQTIGSVEAHGTATASGDPIEVQALSEAFHQYTDRQGFCAPGSVKTNIGHLDAAAGIAGLITVVQALKHKQLPPSLHFQTPPRIDFASSPFSVNTTLRAWQTSDHPRRAGVSSFGIGGTNAHLVVEEAPGYERPQGARPWHLLVLSAHTQAALETATRNLTQALKDHPQGSLADIAYTLQVGRPSFAYRRAVLGSDLQDAIHVLEQRPAQRWMTGHIAPRPLVFLFPGQGTQYTDMGLDLYHSEAVFRQEVDRCAELLSPHVNLDIRTLLYPAPEQRAAASKAFSETQTTQPALFVVEYALACLWMQWGILPQAMIGHSIGEYVAACLSGVFSLETALALVALRGRLRQAMPPGGMLAVPLSESEARAPLGEQLSLAAVNAPDQCVISGPLDALADLQERLAHADTCGKTALLQTSHAFHSQSMEPAMQQFAYIASGMHCAPPRIPFLSNVTGAWITPEQATDPAYWARQLRETVQFCAEITTCARAERYFLEVSPGHTLSSLAIQQGIGPDQVAHSLHRARGQENDHLLLAGSLGKLWLRGAPVDWFSIYQQECRQRVPLPTYPFERQRHWIEPSAEPETRKLPPTRDAQCATWFSRPCWQQAPPVLRREQTERDQQTLLVFLDEESVGEACIAAMREQSAGVLTVRPGNAFTVQGTGYTLDPRRAGAYHALLQDLSRQGKQPTRILHCWGLAASDQQTPRQRYTLALQQTFNSLLLLAQAIYARPVAEKIGLLALTNNALAVLEDELHSPERALVSSICQVLSQEYPLLQCTHLDIALPETQAQQHSLRQRLLADLECAEDEHVIAYSGRQRWFCEYVPFPLPPATFSATGIREQGVSLITGGLGGLGLALGLALAEKARAKLLLLGRTGLPERSQWEAYRETVAPDDHLAHCLHSIQLMELYGSEVLVLQADVTDIAAMQQAVASAYQRFGAIHGVFHLAGVPGTGLIGRKICEEAATVLAPKALGCLVLAEVLQKRPPEIMVLFSSLSSLYGGIGQVEYSAANCFLDAFAQSGAFAGQTRLLSINWGQWQDDRWSEAGSAASASRQQPGLNFAEGFDALLRALASQQPRVIVSPEPLERIAQAVSDDLIEELTARLPGKTN